MKYRTQPRTGIEAGDVKVCGNQIKTISARLIIAIGLITLMFCEVKAQSTSQIWTNDQYRPQIHFSPTRNWMNDPNGLVYYKGVYHLFYQYYPKATVWGPMHWGHATSRDLMRWEHKPVALYPDSLGYIFSGSVVIDHNNTSGFGKNGLVPMVAIFTHHDPVREKKGRIDYQNQSIAYSLDQGMTWRKYKNNPVLKNPGIKDFRDPKVSWNEVAKKWIMTLATLDRIAFYSSSNLKDWKKESEFGIEIGAHGGVWECPDLFSLSYAGKKIWVLIVNLNPGGPNEGSATQYFLGDFDGQKFIAFDNETRWLDYGPDEYAGVTYANTGDRKIFLGWMSNWQYAEKVPTVTWRSAMCIPRELLIKKVRENFYLISKPVAEIKKQFASYKKLQNISVQNFDLTANVGKLSAPAMIRMSSDQIKDFTITLSNSLNEALVIGFDQQANQYFIDRRSSGKIDFEKGFGAKHTAPRFLQSEILDLTLVIDKASVELFADGGLTVMTEIFFPSEDYSKIRLETKTDLQIKSIEYYKMRSMYASNAIAK